MNPLPRPSWRALAARRTDRLRRLLLGGSALTAWPRALGLMLAGPPVAQAQAAAPKARGPEDGPTATSVSPSRRLVFPADHGAHPALRTEWWYVTGALSPADGKSPSWGFQFTIFRSRSPHQVPQAGRLDPGQWMLGHAALSLIPQQRLIHEQALWRSGFERLAAFSTGDCDLRLPGWRLQRLDATSQAGRHLPERYQLSLRSERLHLALQLDCRLPPLLQGQAGYSRKGPSPRQASHYYSRPQLAVSGQVGIGRETPQAVTGSAWMDHEWSDEVLDEQASGWDWTGLNLDDGSSLMAFRIRRRDPAGMPAAAAAPPVPEPVKGDEASTTLWRDLRWFDASGRVLASLPDGADAGQRLQALSFQVLRQWRSPRSGARYPVAMRLQVQAPGMAGARSLELQAAFDDQEIDARASSGGFYWEGLVTVMEGGRRIGQGYLELTGYAAPMKL